MSKRTERLEAATKLSRKVDETRTQHKLVAALISDKDYRGAEKATLELAQHCRELAAMQPQEKAAGAGK